MTHYAHTGSQSDESDWQTLSDHLIQVGRLASVRAEAFGAAEWANLIGMLHDLGKYSAAFQRRLRGSPERTDHATAGAIMVIEHLTSEFGPQIQPFAKLLAFTIAGHHAGLANGVDDGKERSTLKQRLALKFGDDLAELDAVWKEEISLPKGLKLPLLKPSRHKNFGLAFFTRMLFSCLIDADRLDTEIHARQTIGAAPLRTRQPGIEVLQCQLNRHLKVLAQAAPTTEVNTLRQHILGYARQRAAMTPGLFSLTVPTGGGKTLTSLAFGLDHARAHQLRRVIYVIPFTSIIEQTAEVFRKALGPHADAVLEHHSAFDRDRLPVELAGASKARKADHRDKLRLAMESWDAPVVVTTAVQFFESLFSDRPSQCRKLHNIAGSVIVLDEAQTLPLKLLRPIMAAIEELALNYRCTVVLCTATQPALKDSDDFHNGFVDVREIAPNPPELFEKLRRTQVQSIGDQSDEELIEHLRRNDQVLMIVNNRRHARVLFDGIANEPGAFHLTTAMCPQHRSLKLAEVRQRLRSGEPCRLVATSLIEAGVDVSFPIVYRAEAGLDSIAQAAGRCNREGLRPIADSLVYVFRSPDWRAPPELVQLAAPMRSILRNHEGDVLGPHALKAYFQQVYYDQGADLDHHGILKSLRVTEQCDFPFQDLAASFRMIESKMLPIIVPLDPTSCGAIEALRHAEHVGAHARSLQRYVVQVPEKVFAKLLKVGAIAAIAPERFAGQFYELQTMSIYSEVAGLNISDPVAVAAESCVI